MNFFMKPIGNSDIENIAFYENRYVGNYMDEWDNVKKNRIVELIKGMNLPDKGNLLDFGCGTGVFTILFKKILPKWNIYGCDVSKNAIDKAKQKKAQCYFFVQDLNIIQDYINKFDFIYSHHVLEHVFNIEDTILMISNYCKKGANVFHILPCGNSDSFEHRICKLVKNGVDEVSGRFFYEDIGHLRRLRSSQLNIMHQEIKLEIVKEWFALQYYGAFRWIIESGKPFINELTSLNNALDDCSRGKLKRIRIKMLRMHQGYMESKQMKNINIFSSKVLKDIFQNPLKYIKKVYKVWLYTYYFKMSKIEWMMKKRKKNGSEMYLLYKKN